MTRRFVIVGNSPHRDTTPNLPQLILSSTVIGVNRAPLYSIPLDHWVVWDTHDMLENLDMVKALRNLHRVGHTAWLRESWYTLDGYPPFPFISYKVQLFEDSTQGWDWQNQNGPRLKLPCRGSVCTTAAALACLLGADEIWLVGVDFATSGPTPDWTEEVLTIVARFVNEFFKDFPIPVYKTYDGGPLELEYRKYEGT